MREVGGVLDIVGDLCSCCRGCGYLLKGDLLGCEDMAIAHFFMASQLLFERFESELLYGPSLAMRRPSVSDRLGCSVHRLAKLGSASFLQMMLIDNLIHSGNIGHQAAIGSHYIQ